MKPLTHTNCGTAITVKRRYPADHDHLSYLALWCPRCEVFIDQPDTSSPDGAVCLAKPSDLHTETPVR
jgi:hypothetical protein